jgi:hypothetical protein
MARIGELYLAMLTRSAGSDPGTNSGINLVINDGQELLNHRFEATGQPDQERGQANLYWLDVRSLGIDSARLAPGSMRLEVLGDDEWRPESVFLWGFTSGRFSVGRSAMALPLAIETDIAERLSSSDSDAVPSMPLRPVHFGGGSMPINRLLLILGTVHDSDDSGAWWPPWESHSRIGDPTDQPGAGTDDRIGIEIVASDRLVVQHVIPDTSQDDLNGDQANLYMVPVAVPFTRASLAADAVRLNIDGDDVWWPARVFLFGLSARTGRPDSIIPLVHHDPWGLGSLSTDPNEGNAQVVLPLLPLTRTPDTLPRSDG